MPRSTAAIRAGVSFWPIDARGLVAQAPLGDATQGSPGNIGMYSGAAALAMTTNFQQSQDTLYALAGDTGGKALLDYNDLTKGIVQAQQNVSSYYILGYYTSNTTQDGKFRRIKISLNANLSANLDYRQGYYASKLFSKFTAADKERQLEDALMLEDPITELTIAMEIDYFQLNRAEYFVPIIVKIPGRELALAKRGGAEHTLIDFIGEIKDNYGATITNVRDKVNIKLSDATAIELAKRPIEYDTGFTILPGKYTIKFLARDDETGRIGTYQTTFVIPNLNKEEKRIPISSVVLSSQRIELKDALYNAIKAKDREEAANPLVLDGQKLIPSVTRVFSKSRDMYVYLQAYEQGAPSVQPLIAFVSFYRAQTKAFETQPIEVTDALNNRLSFASLLRRGTVIVVAPLRIARWVTAFYYLRRQPMEVGHTIELPVNDGSKTQRVVVEVQAREKVQTPMGTFDALRVEPKVFSGLLKRKGRMLIWFSADERQLPLRIKAMISVGSITGTLRSVTHQKENASPAMS